VRRAMRSIKRTVSTWTALLWDESAYPPPSL